MVEFFAAVGVGIGLLLLIAAVAVGVVVFLGGVLAVLALPVAFTKFLQFLSQKS